MKKKKHISGSVKTSAQQRRKNNTNVSTREASRQRSGNNGPQQGSH